MKTDERAFPCIGNNLSIDFLNTQIVESGEVVELIQYPSDVYRWARAVEVSVDRSVKHSDLKTVYDFRNALRSIFHAVLDDKKVPMVSVEILNQYLILDSKCQQLKYSKGKFELQPKLNNLNLEELLGQVAGQAASLLSSAQIKKLKKCANEKCILLFLDVSKSGKRRWCSMEICGNRAKASKHYIKQKGCKN